MSVGISILSWRGAKTLDTSLDSYIQADLFSLFDESQIFLPDPDTAVIETARRAPVTVRNEALNLGIMENMARAAEAMSSDYILMLENDCPLIANKAECERQISVALDLLLNPNIIVARLRSVRSPGQAFTGLAKYRRLFANTPGAKLRRILRPEKIERLTGYALYDSIDPTHNHPAYFENVGNSFFLVDTKVMPWTNQSILIHRETFLNEIVSMARAVKTRRGSNRLPNLEVELNKAKAWRNSGWKIACGPGLFTHERIGDRGYE